MFIFLIITLCAGGEGQFGTVCEDVVASSSQFDPTLNMVSCQINGQNIAIAFRNASLKYHDYALTKYACTKGERKVLG